MKNQIYPVKKAAVQRGLIIMALLCSEPKLLCGKHSLRKLGILCLKK